MFSETKQDVIFLLGLSALTYIYAYNRPGCKVQVPFLGTVLEDANVILFLRLVHFGRFRGN